MRALRLPLLAALAVNLAAVAVTPLYRARTAQLPPPRATSAGEFDSLPVSSDAPGQDGDESTTEIAGPGPATVADPPADSARPMDMTPVESPDSDQAAATDHSDSVSPAEAQLPLSAETLSDVGRSFSQVNDSAHSLGRSVAHVAGRATRWLNAIADSADPASNVSADENVSDRSPDDNGSAPPHSADTTRDGRDARSIVISNAAGANLPVAFLVDEQAQSLAPGKRLEIPASQATVRFDRGQSFGESTRTLAPGVYRFVVTDRGWDLLGPDTAVSPAFPTSVSLSNRTGSRGVPSTARLPAAASGSAERSHRTDVVRRDGRGPQPTGATAAHDRVRAPGRPTDSDSTAAASYSEPW